MTPDETNTDPLDEHLLARVIACDALLHADSDHSDRPSQPPRSDDEADDRARSRLLLLLRLLDAVDATSADAADRPHTEPTEGHTLLGRFEILEDLGAGGFGFVVRARDRLLGREVALKMPLPERMLGPGDVRRFLREAQAAARLDHPHIVRVFDAGELGPLGYFIAAEFAAGPSLRQWLKAQTQPVSARMAAAWAAALADAAQHAHDRGILHRDIKPDNVILASAPPPDAPIPRLTDFGLAKVLEEAGDETRSGARVGTPHYMAPEQAAGNLRDIGPATDIYALGATLYEVLTGRPPFRGENEAETLRLVLDAEPVAPRSLRPGLPRDLETICLKCLRKEPARRYTTAADLRDDLRRFLDGRPIVGRPVFDLRARLALGSPSARRRCPGSRGHPPGMRTDRRLRLVGELAGVAQPAARDPCRPCRSRGARGGEADADRRGAPAALRSASPCRGPPPRADRRSMPARSSWRRTSCTTSGPSRAATIPAASRGVISGGGPIATSRSSGGMGRPSWGLSCLAMAGRSSPGTCKASTWPGTSRPAWTWTGRASFRSLTCRIWISSRSRPTAVTWPGSSRGACTPRSILSRRLPVGTSCASPSPATVKSTWRASIQAVGAWRSSALTVMECNSSTCRTPPRIPGMSRTGPSRA